MQYNYENMYGIHNNKQTISNLWLLTRLDIHKSFAKELCIIV